MSSTLYETLDNIEKGRQNCLKNAKLANLNPHENMSIYDIGELFLKQNNNQAIYKNWERSSDWWDTEEILLNAEKKDGLYPAYILLLADWDKTTQFSKTTSYKALQGDGYLTSDGAWYVGDATHTWDTTKDKECSLGYKTRYVIVYVANPAKIGAISLRNFSCLEFVAGSITIQSGGLEFNGNNQIISVVYTDKTIQTTISSFYMFSSCTALKNIYMPSVEIIGGSNTISGCSALTNLSLPSLTTINGNDVINNCNALTNLSLPSLTTISSNAIQRCNALASIFFPSLTSISGSGFASNCSSLNDITIPSTCRNINFTSMLSGCNALKAVNLYNDWEQSGLTLTSCNLAVSCMLDMFNKLADMTSEEGIYTLVLGTNNLAKLTEEEIAVATNKGWVIS